MTLQREKLQLITLPTPLTYLKTVSEELGTQLY